MTDIMIDKTHKIYYDPELEMVTVASTYGKADIHLSETAVLKMLEYMLNHGLRSNINIGTVRDEIAYRDKEQEKKDRLEEYIQDRIKKEYYEDIPNSQYIHITTKERVSSQDIREKILKEIEYVSKLM